MKNRSSRSIVCGLGLAAMLSGCSPTNSPSSAGSPASATPLVATPGQTASPLAPTTPSAQASSSFTPGASTSPGMQQSPGTDGTPNTKANVPVIEGVAITVAKAGAGEALTKGTKASFHYTGWLEGFESAKKFDSSRGKDPLDFEVGQGMVIPGWDQGLIGMQPGEIRRLTINPEMAYGADGHPPVIPPNSTLYFEVEYLGPVK